MTESNFQPNALAEYWRSVAQGRGETADRVIDFEPEYDPGPDKAIERDSRCPRFQLLPRGHKGEKQCIYCFAPLQELNTDG